MLWNVGKQEKGRHFTALKNVRKIVIWQYVYFGILFYEDLFTIASIKEAWDFDIENKRNTSIITIYCLIGQRSDRRFKENTIIRFSFHQFLS